MPSKQAIIDNIEEYDASELVRYIHEGIVSFDELVSETEGYFPANVRREVRRLLETSEDNDWMEACRINTEAAYRSYLANYPEGKHRAEARSAIAALNTPPPVPHDDDPLPPPAPDDTWDSVDKTSVHEVQRYVEQNPDSPHLREARKLLNRLISEEFVGFDTLSLKTRINDIQTDRYVNDPVTATVNLIADFLDRRKISGDDVLELIRQDNNFLNATVITRLIEEGYFTYTDFLRIGIDRAFVEQLAKRTERAVFPAAQPIDHIGKLCTEVYFWGIPSSGKSCALGGILSMAGSGRVARSMSRDNDCQGYGYMTRLAKLFDNNGRVTTLPEGTSIFSTYEMGFDLEDANGAIHPITCVDLAGELVRIMYKNDAREELSDDELESLDLLTRLLIDERTNNRKVHFFVLEYGGENRQYEGLTQREYLDAALRYIERTGIFARDTDAIYMLFTKVDKTGLTGEDLINELVRYTELYYADFFHGLEKICRDHEINGGRVERLPFTLGRVCFQDYCLFDGTSAANVVGKLLERTKGFATGKKANFFKKLKG